MMKKLGKTIVFALLVVSMIATALPVSAATIATNQSSSETYTSASATRKAEIASEIKSIFDAKYYAAMNEDVRVSCGVTDLDELTERQEELLWQHFWYTGIYETRQCCEEFNVNAYACAYGDLRAAYDTDVIAYYLHYIEAVVNGSEDRTYTTITAALKAGFSVYKITEYESDSASPWANATCYGQPTFSTATWSYYAGSCYTTAVKRWLLTQPTMETDMEELGITYDSDDDVYYVGDTAVDGTSEAYRELIDRLYSLYDIWYAQAPEAADYYDTYEKYLSYLSLKPDLDVIGCGYSTVFDCFYVKSTTITTAQYASLSSASRAYYIYIGDEQFAQKLSWGSSSAAMTAVTKWKAYYVNPCANYDGVRLPI